MSIGKRKYKRHHYALKEIAHSSVSLFANIDRYNHKSRSFNEALHEYLIVQSDA